MSAPSRLVAVGASAGGIEAISMILGDLPKEFPAPVLIVMHVAAAPSILPRIFERAGALPVRHPADGERLEPGVVLVAPPDFHMTVEDAVVRLSHGPRENRHRPAIDPLFRSVAETYRDGAIGVILTGALGDGTAGLAALCEAGGIAVVQDPATALHPSMPSRAIAAVRPRHVVPSEDIAPLLVRLLADGPDGGNGARTRQDVEEEVDMAHGNSDFAVARGDDHAGELTGFTCPECSGTLWEVREGGVVKFRCRVGHAYSTESFVVAQAEALEAALWAAMRALDEREALANRLAARMRAADHQRSAEQFDLRAADSRRHAAVIRDVLGALVTEVAEGDIEAA